MLVSKWPLIRQQCINALLAVRSAAADIKRQQTFLRAVMHEVGSTRNPVTLARIGDARAEAHLIEALRHARGDGGLNTEGRL